MGLLNIFSSKNPEDYESKGDKLAETGAFGKAIVEYERALARLEKTAPWDDGFRQNLKDKILDSREALVLQHKKTAMFRQVTQKPHEMRTVAYKPINQTGK